jgi:hypothetical protein
MQNLGLTNRLRHHSRRAGLAIGLSMALTIALFIGSFSWIYAKIDPMTKDFVDTVEVTPRATPDEIASASTEEAEQTPEPTTTGNGSDQPPADTPTQTPSPTSEAFRQTHISNPEISVNLRPESNVNNEPVAVLDAGTPLQFLNDQETGDDGAQWFKFRIEDGTEGWLREGTFVESTG